MYLRGRLESQVGVGGSGGGWELDLVCMKNFGELGGCKRPEQTAHIVPFEGHFERPEDFQLVIY